MISPLAHIHPAARLAPGVTVEPFTTIYGDVEIGENTVIHPYAKIRSDRGSVQIGKNCTVCEKAVVGITDGEGTVVIGDGVNIETGAQVEAAVVGDGTSIEVRAIIGKGAVLGKVGEYLGFVCRSA